MSQTLATDRTIRACLTLKPTKEREDDLAFTEIMTIVEVGIGINGYPDTCHGGFVATLLDEVCGILIVLNMEKKMERQNKGGFAEPHRDMTYMTACKCIVCPGGGYCCALICDRLEYNIQETCSSACNSSMYGKD
jgi:hypothetical protein